MSIEYFVPIHLVELDIFDWISENANPWKLVLDVLEIHSIVIVTFH